MIFGDLSSLSKKDFIRATGLFLFLALTAVILNLYGSAHAAGGVMPNLFYLSPLRPTHQPVFGLVEEKAGILPARILYLLSLITGSSILFQLEKKCLNRIQTSSNSF